MKKAQPGERRGWPGVRSRITELSAAALKTARWLEPRTIRGSVVALVCAFSLPLLLATMFFMVNGINKDIDVARLELDGDRYQEPLEGLLEAIASHQRLAMQRPQPVPGFERRLLELRIDGLWRDLEVVQSRLGRELQFTREGLQKRNRGHVDLPTVEGEWRSLRDAGPLGAEENKSRHQHLAEDLRAMIAQSGDTSGLILDPDLDSYYLMDATLQALPQTQDRLAAFAAELRNLPATGMLPEPIRTRLAVTAAFLREADQDRITGDIGTSLNEDDGFNGRSQSLHVNLPPAVRRYVAANQALVAAIGRAIDAPDAASLRAVPDAADRAREASFALWWVAEPELDRLLHARIANRQQARSVGFAMMGISVLLSGFLTLLMLRRITGPIAHLSSVARRISIDRDYSVRARGIGTGEIGALIDSFNGMLEQIQIHEITAESLRESEERYAIAAQGANDGLWDWKLATGEIYFSPRWNEMLGYPGDYVWSDPEEWFRRIHRSDRARVRAEIAEHMKGAKPEFVSEYRIAHFDEGFVWVLSRGIAVRGEDGVAVRIAGSHTDITEGKLADPLTGLRNRLYFADRLESAIRAGGGFAVLVLDLDKFKQINDSLGHEAGDRLLAEVAARLVGTASSAPGKGAGPATVARFGGDEFAVLLTALPDDRGAEIMAARILEDLSVPFLLDGRQVFASASIGVAMGSSAATPDELLRNADTAMYNAKAKGKACYEVFDESMRERAAERLEIETNLRKAIDDGQLLLHYQASIALADQRLIGFEALVRWNHPQRGILNPGEFIPIAEESDLIVPLGRWVLREACRQMAEWQRSLGSDPPLTISVNISPRQLGDAHLIDDLEAILAETGLSHSTLKLEITESSIMQDPEKAVVTLGLLKDLNIGLEVDDFGTGYSSLSYLQKFPFDTVKIDRSFIRDLGDNPEDSKIVATIVRLAQSLDMRVIAEGVETADQVRHLEKLGCDAVQGYYFSKPVGARKVMAVMHANGVTRSLFALALATAESWREREPATDAVPCESGELPDPAIAPRKA